ncbi:hypothetical protein GCM10009764_23380 [Nocardia ninae]
MDVTAKVSTPSDAAIALNSTIRNAVEKFENGTSSCTAASPNGVFMVKCSAGARIASDMLPNTQVRDHHQRQARDANAIHINGARYNAFN